MKVQAPFDIEKIFAQEVGFEAVALELFRFQYAHTTVYKRYVDALRINPKKVNKLASIPFLPIKFFKTHKVTAGDFDASLVFESSGTTGMVNSKHYLNNAFLYEKSFTNGFANFYGNIEEWCVIGLLPSYLGRQNASLVYMARQLIKMSGHRQSGFYLNEFEKLRGVLQSLEERGQKTLLIGVTFALLDFAAQYPMPLKHTIIMETGGMKGRRREMSRPEVHDILKKSFSLNAIHSEYGMTELLSQAYSKGGGIFNTPLWMKVLLRDEEDPLTIKRVNKDGVNRGVINIIDLANVYSCGFIATEDLGALYPDGAFEVNGRLDNSDVRGCSLLVL